MADLLIKDRAAKLAPAGKIFHIQQPQFPQFRFEWHPETKRVYLIRLGQVPLVGEPFAFDIMDPGAASNAVLIWLRGYREGATKIIEKKETN